MNSTFMKSFITKMSLEKVVISGKTFIFFKADGDGFTICSQTLHEISRVLSTLKRPKQG